MSIEQAVQRLRAGDPDRWSLAWGEWDEVAAAVLAAQVLASDEDLVRLLEESAALLQADTLHMLPIEAHIASVKDLSEKLVNTVTDLLLIRRSLASSEYAVTLVNPEFYDELTAALAGEEPHKPKETE